jgi:TPR repeat protein
VPSMRQDWREHKPICQRTEFAGAPCDRCGKTEDVEVEYVCLSCGFLYCKACNEQQLTRDLSGRGTSLTPCPRCHAETRISLHPRNSHKKLEKLIKESPRDPRLANWLIHLGGVFLGFDDTRRGEQKAKEQFLRAGELGFGEGYSRLAEISINHRNWQEAKLFYQKAAERYQVTAICALAGEAARGYFDFGDGDAVQEDSKSPPDWEKAFCLFREGARLGCGVCCHDLGVCYRDGSGTELNLAKAFKWFRMAAEKGHTVAMRKCAFCYGTGEGVEQSNEQAIYWYEKCLELDDDDDVARHNLQILRHSP